MTELFHYSSDYTPPAPVASLIIESIRSGARSEPLTALIDSGADRTIVPLEILESIREPVSREAWLHRYGATRQLVGMHLVTLEFGSIRLPAIEVIGATDDDELIVGRDALNQLRVLLDGLGETVELSS